MPEPKKVFVNDINRDLIQVYTTIKDDVEGLIAALSEYRNESDFFYAVRDWDRNKEKYAKMTGIEKSARLIYLNKTCYNGLYRVNNASFWQ